MLPYLILDQITLGPVKLYTWGLFVGLGFSAGYLWLLFLAHQKDLAPAKIAGLALAIFAGAALGAKSLAIVLTGDGAMFMGGLIGAIICGVLYILLLKLDVWQVADLLVLPVLLGIGLGRIGCILINDHQGAITSLPWGILWPDGVTRHPVAAYESLAGFGLLVAFCLLRKIFIKPGHLFLVFLASYSAIRFFLDFTRVAAGSLADPQWGVLSVSQWSALAIFMGVILAFLRREYRY